MLYWEKYSREELRRNYPSSDLVVPAGRVNLTFTPYANLLFATALFSMVAALLIWRRGKVPGSGILVLLMFAIAEWSLTSGFEAAALGLPQKILWAKMEYLGVTFTPTLFLLFTFEYSLQARLLRPLNLIALALVPLSGLILALTNEWHGLIWTGFTPSPLYQNLFIYGHGIGYYVLLAYNYLISFLAILILVRVWYRSQPPYRRQTAIILVGSFFPLIGGLLYNLNLNPFPGVDLIPISFALTGLVVILGIIWFQLFDRVPIARDILIEHMGDGVLVLDVQNRLADINPIAIKMLQVTGKKYIGRPASSVLKSWPTLVQHFQDVQDVKAEICLEDDPLVYLDMHVTPLYDHHEHYTGRLIILRDITERRRTEAELARNIEELGIINRISLAVTTGLDMERVLKTLQEQCSQVVPIDIFYVALFDEATSLINIPLYFENGKYQTGTSRDINEHPGILGTIIKGRKTVYLHDALDPVTRPLKRETGELKTPIMSYVGIPLSLRERVIGVMSIQNRQPNAYRDDQIHLLERIAIQAAIAIENARLYAEEQRLAIVDELTGIYNYRGLVELGAREVDRARRFNRPLSALFFDIDDFRKFNNTYSHSVGNLILQTVAQRCRAILRSVDVFARYGGDEFTALLPETDLANAEEVARRLYDEISKTKITTPHGELGVTISIGVTMFTEDIPDLYRLVDRANHAERQAKKNNQGVVVVVVG